MSSFAFKISLLPYSVILKATCTHHSLFFCFKCKKGRGATGDFETGDAETGDTKTSEREREGERLVMKCTFSVIVSCNLSTSIFGIG